MLLKLIEATLFSHMKYSEQGYLEEGICDGCLRRTLWPVLYSQLVSNGLSGFNDFRPLYPNTVFIVLDACGLNSVRFELMRKVLCKTMETLEMNYSRPIGAGEVKVAETMQQQMQ